MAEPLDPLQESLRVLVDAEKLRPEPPLAIQERVFARLATDLGLPTVSGPVQPTPTSSLASPPLAAGRMLARVSRRAVATFLVGAAVGATVYGTVERVSRSHSEPPTPAVPARVSEPPVPLPSAPAVATPALVPRPAATEEPASHSSVGFGDGRDRGLAAERKLVEMARTALMRGQTEGALAALARHVRQFPRGQLAEERDSLYVQTLVARGEHARARARGKRFHLEHPHSLFAPVVDQALRSIP
jgi:hypothetical protein